jgi:hypothetical protein
MAFETVNGVNTVFFQKHESIFLTLVLSLTPLGKGVLIRFTRRIDCWISIGLGGFLTWSSRSFAEALVNPAFFFVQPSA